MNALIKITKDQVVKAKDEVWTEGVQTIAIVTLFVVEKLIKYQISNPWNITLETPWSLES